MQAGKEYSASMPLQPPARSNLSSLFEVGIAGVSIDAVFQDILEFLYDNYLVTWDGIEGFMAAVLYG